MIKHLLVSFFFFFLSAFCFGQNLVPNPSFENNYRCPTSSDEVDSCIGWHSILNTPDYFATCSPYPASIPQNFMGYQTPFEGDFYIGLATYQWTTLYREIVGCSLVTSLIPGNNYAISMRVSRGNWTNQSYNCAASNKLGIRLTTRAYSAVFQPSIDNWAQVYTDSIITDTLNWVLLQWNYIADSAYQYIYIGNFFDDAHTDTTVINAPLGQYGIAYYFIDSINLNCIDRNCISSVSEQPRDKSLINFNSITKRMQFNLDLSNSSLVVFNASGQAIQLLNDVPPEINFSNLNSGVYVVQIKTPKEIFNTKFLIY